MNKQFLYLVLLVSFLLSGCARFKTEQRLDQARADLDKAIEYNAEEFAPDRIDMAKGSMQLALRMQQLNRMDKALDAADNSRWQASEALRLAVHSWAAVKMKKAIEASELVVENQAEAVNPAIYASLLRDLQNARRAYLGKDYERSIILHNEVIDKAEILLQPLKKEAEVALERASKALVSNSLTAGQKSRIEEAKQNIKSRNYYRALTLLEEWR